MRREEREETALILTVVELLRPGPTTNLRGLAQNENARPLVEK